MRTVFKSIATFTFCVSLFSSYSQEVDEMIDSLSRAEVDSQKYQLNIDIGYRLLSQHADSARIFFSEAIELGNQLGDDSKRARSLTLTGLTYYFTGEFDQAVKFYLDALPISESLKNDRYTGIISNNIGAVYFELGDFEETSKFYEKAVGHFTIAKDTFWLSNALNNLGNVLEKQHNFEASINIFHESLELARLSNNREAIGSAMSNLGNVYLAMEDLDKAYEQYTEGLKIQREANDLVGEAISLNNIGQILTRKGQGNQAILRHQKALEIAKEINNLETVSNSHKRLAEAFSSIGKFQQAFKHQFDFTSLQDSLVGIERANSIEELNKKYEAEKKDKQIAEFQLEKQSSALELARSNNQRNILIGISILIFGSATLFYSLFKQKKRALNERETLLKEIHHRVKNNLQIISSLLNLQAGSLEDEAAIDAVKEGQNRVKSMALIHENLYQNDDLSGIEVDEYIENLTRTLYGSFGVDEEKIKTNLSVEKIRLDIDTLIPLGLMLNELLCNALKYAFPEGQGNLALSLRQSENKLDLKVKDDGPGISKEKLENGNSYGWKMIKSLSRKLKADISIENDRGTQISLSIRNYQLVT